MAGLSTKAWGMLDDFYGSQFDRILKSLDDGDAHFVNDFLGEMADNCCLTEEAGREVEAQEKSDETRGGKRPNAGQKPFGAKEGEKQKMKMIQRCKRLGMSLSEIARKLNGLNWGTKLGKKWRAETVKNVLKRNPEN